MAAYLGPPIPLARILRQAPHGLQRQSYAPRHMLTGKVNADGFGVAWYPGAGVPPARYRSLLPIWADPNLDDLGRVIRSGVVLAAVRGATVPGTTAYADTQPFLSGSLTFMHNGFIEDFHRRLMRRIRAQVSDAAYADLRGSSDSETLFALFRTLTRDATSPEGLMEGLERTCETAGRLCREAGSAALLTLLVGNGNALAGIRAAVGRPEAPSLFLCHASDLFPGAAVVASEPLDDSESRWQALPEGRPFAVTWDGGRCEVYLP